MFKFFLNFYNKIAVKISKTPLENIVKNWKFSLENHIEKFENFYRKITVKKLSAEGLNTPETPKTPKPLNPKTP